MSFCKTALVYVIYFSLYNTSFSQIFVPNLFKGERTDLFIRLVYNNLQLPNEFCVYEMLLIFCRYLLSFIHVLVVIARVLVIGLLVNMT